MGGTEPRHPDCSVRGGWPSVPRGEATTGGRSRSGARSVPRAAMCCAGSVSASGQVPEGARGGGRGALGGHSGLVLVLEATWLAEKPRANSCGPGAGASVSAAHSGRRGGVRLGRKHLLGPQFLSHGTVLRSRLTGFSYGYCREALSTRFGCLPG